MDTAGSLIDKLSIVNIKIFKAEDAKRDPDATDEEIASSTRLTNRLNKHRNDLIGELDDILGFENDGNIKMYGK